jgi:anti-sigma B factor antagonist
MIVRAVTDQPSPGAVTLRVSGEVDIGEKDDFCRAIAECAHDLITMVVLDLTQVTYLGSAGLSAMLAGQRLLKSRGVPLYVDGCSDIVERVLQVSQLRDHLPRPSAAPAAQDGPSRVGSSEDVVGGCE